MKKIIIAATLVASVAVAATAAFAHRTTPTAPPPAVKQDFAKTLFDQLERNRR